MKKKIAAISSLGFAALAVLVILSLVIGKQVNSEGGYDGDYLLAVFDSTEGWNDSTLFYYDKEFRLVHEQRFAMGSIADSFSPPIRYKDKIYVAPQWSLGTRRDKGQVVEIDRNTGKCKTYKVGQHSAAALAVSERYIFTVSNWGDAKLARTDKNTGEVKELDFPDENIFQIDAYGDELYVFPEHLEAETASTRCVIMNIESLAVVDSFDMTAYGQGADYTYMKDGKLYIPLSRTCADEYNDCLLCYDTGTKELEAVNLGRECPAQILEWKDWLVITHVDLFGGENKNCAVTLYNPQTGERKRYWVSGVLDQAAIKDDCMYALDIIQNSIYVYDLNSTGEHLELLERHTVKTKDQDSKYAYYTAGFFLK